MQAVKGVFRLGDEIGRFADTHPKFSQKIMFNPLSHLALRVLSVQPSVISTQWYFNVKGLHYAGANPNISG